MLGVDVLKRLAFSSQGGLFIGALYAYNVHFVVIL